MHYYSRGCGPSEILACDWGAYSSSPACTVQILDRAVRRFQIVDVADGWQVQPSGSLRRGQQQTGCIVPEGVQCLQCQSQEQSCRRSVLSKARSACAAVTVQVFFPTRKKEDSICIQLYVVIAAWHLLQHAEYGHVQHELQAQYDAH